MPIKDDTKRREYFRDYMARRRAGKPAKATASADALAAAQAEIDRLKAELARAQAAPKPGPAFRMPMPDKLVPPTPEQKRAQRERAKIEAMRAAAAKLTAEQERSVLEKLERAEQQLKACRTQIKNLKANSQVSRRPITAQDIQTTAPASARLPASRPRPW